MIAFLLAAPALATGLAGPPVVGLPPSALEETVATWFGGRAALDLGRISVPFGDAGARSPRLLMADAERAVVTQGLPLTGADPGVLARVEPLGALGLELGLLADGRGLDTLSEREPRPPHAVTRVAWSPGQVEVGASSFVGDVAASDFAWGVDAAAGLGHWQVSAAYASERITGTKRAFEEDLDLRRVEGDRAQVRIARELDRRWTVGVEGAAAVYTGKRQVVVPPWVRGVASLEYGVVRRLGGRDRERLRWTVVEAATLAVVGGVEPILRVGTSLDVTAR